MHLEMIEFVDNPEPRCPVMLFLDTSDSMSGEPIKELNEGLAAFKYAVETDPLAALRVELSLVTFGGKAQIYQNFRTIDLFVPPKLETQGKTPLGEALEIGFEALNQRKEIYKKLGVPYYRPWVFLITDGAPTDEGWYKSAQDFQKADQAGKLMFFTIAVKGADRRILGQIAAPGRPPIHLKDLRFRELFLWVSTSIRMVSVSRTALNLDCHGIMQALPPVNTWAVDDLEYEDL